MMAGNSNGQRCGLCWWYDPADPKTGRCMIDPPQIHLAAVPSLTGGQPRPVVQGLRPPVGEGERCHRFTALPAETLQ